MSLNTLFRQPAPGGQAKQWGGFRLQRPFLADAVCSPGLGKCVQQA